MGKLCRVLGCKKRGWVLSHISLGRQDSVGFSLIELMIALAVSAILLALAAPGFTSFIRNSQIRTAAESVQTGLQLARSEAVKRNTLVQFVLSSVQGGGSRADWSVSVVSPSTVIQSRPSAEGTSKVSITVDHEDHAAITFSGLGRPLPHAKTATIDVKSE